MTKPELVVPAGSVRYSGTWIKKDTHGNYVDGYGMDSDVAIPAPATGEPIEVKTETGKILNGYVTKVSWTYHFTDNPPYATYILIVEMV